MIMKCRTLRGQRPCMVGMRCLHGRRGARAMHRAMQHVQHTRACCIARIAHACMRVACLYLSSPDGTGMRLTKNAAAQRQSG